jgi:hypothetical protein
MAIICEVKNMGAYCASCNCSQEREVATVSLQADRQTRAQLKAILRVQAWFRGYRCRKQLASTPEYCNFLQLRKRKTVQLKSSYNQNSKIELEERSEVLLPDGIRYTGQWLKGENEVRHGYGRCVWPDGAVYEGNWKFDKACGQGTFLHTHGDKYEGEWYDDKAHGHGVYTHSNGAKYEGSWENDL